MSTKQEKIILLFILIVGLWLRVWNINFGLPFVPQADEPITINRALRFGTGDLNPHFFYYPSLQMYLSFILFGIYFLIGRVIGFFQSVTDFTYAFIKNPTPIYVIGRMSSVILGTLTIWGMYLLGKRIHNTKIGLFCAGITAILPVLILHSHYVKGDVPMLCLIVFSYLYLFSGLNINSFKPYLIAGILLGLATGFKYTAILGIIAGAINLLIRLFIFKDSWLIVTKKIVVFILFIILGFIFSTPYAVLDGKKFIHDILDQTSYHAAGHSGTDNLNIIGEYLKLILGYGGGKIYLFGITCLFGILLSLRRRQVKDWFLLGTLVGITVLVTRQRLVGYHYYFTIFPILIIISAAGINEVQNLYTRFIRSKIINILIISLLFTPSTIDSIYTINKMGIKDTRILAREWIDKTVLKNTKLLCDPEGPPLKLTKEIIQIQYDLAKRINHIKKDYFRLQLETYSGYGYDVYNTLQPYLITPLDLKEYSQSVQRLEPIDQGIEYLRRKGFVYFITSSWNYDAYWQPERRKMYPQIAQLYETLSQTLVLVKEFNPEITNGPGPTIKIYKFS